VVEAEVQKDYYAKAKKEVEKEVAAERKLIADLRNTAATASTARGDLEKKYKKLEDDLVGERKKLRELNEDLERTRTSLAALADKTGQDVRLLDSASLDLAATRVLRSWTKDWKVVNIDAKGTAPYINLGSADGLEPQVTFSVHAAGPNVKLTEVPKATLEVVRIVGPHLAQTRVTSIKDPKANPILRNDRLFNPTWDPTRRKQVAIAGIADLGGDGSDSTEDLRRLLARQRTDVSAYIDTKDEKEPKVVGPGITSKTEYLILGDNMEGSMHPRSRDKEYANRFDKKIKEMKDKAAENGVQLITLRKYLDMMGYKPPRVTSSSTGR